jgi:ribonucleoside-diphosphate reductase alpha chain
MSSEIIEEVLKSRYYLPGETSWADICKRVSTFIGYTNEQRADYFDMMNSKEFLPNSPCLFNAGTKTPLMSACFALGIDDSMESIYNALYKSAILFKMGAGVGFNFSRIRPEGATVGSTMGVASGVLSFIRVFNESIDVIKQAGRRRGAAIAILNCDHPEIEAFIKSKTVDGKLTNFNISVLITDDFIKAVENDLPWDLKFNDKVYKTLPARDLFKLMYESTWKYGDPGYLYEGNMNRDNPNIHLGRINCTNPCGEINILTDHISGGGESCNLGSIDVSKFLNTRTIDYERLEKTIRKSVRFLNAVIHKNDYPFKEIEMMTKKTAKVGLGIMGWADLLILKKIPYDSEDACKLATNLMKYINEIAINESVKIASESGAYPAWHGSTWEKNGISIANSTLTCQAPTGTISIIADCSSGIEPVIAFVHKRKNCVGKEFFVIHKLFENALKEECKTSGENYDDVIQHCYKTGTIQDIPWLSSDFKRVFKSSLDIGWKDHLLMQAAFQKSVGNSISKTINAPKDTPPEDIKDAILMAWKLGCKGFTLYRIGSKENEVISLSKDTTNEETHDDDGAMEDYPMERPDVLFGATYVSQSGCGKLYTTINYLESKPYEVFVFSGGSGGCQAQNEGVGRLASLALRNQIDYKKVIKQLKKVKCPVAMKNQNAEGKSCADIIGDIISMSMGDDTMAKEQPNLKTLSPRARDTIKVTPAKVNIATKCPDCGEPLEFGEGCNKGACPNCGWSGCA